MNKVASVNEENYLEEHISDQPADQFRITSLNSFVIKQLPPKGNVLDYGCGAGHFMRRLANFPEVETVDGAEVSPKLIKQSIKNNPSSRLFNAENDKLPANYYDRIYSLDVLEHIEDDKKTLKLLFNSLKSGGLIFIGLPAHMDLYTEFDKKIGHFRRYEKEELASKAKEAGFKIIKLRFWNRLGQIVVRRSIEVGKPRPQSIDRKRNLKQELQNNILKLWFWLIENRIEPKDGLTLICIAQKP